MGRLEASHILHGHKGRVWGVAWHPEGHLLASCGEDKTVRVWGRDGAKWVCKTSLSDGHTRTVRSVAWSLCGRLMASASFDGTTSVWTYTKGDYDCTMSLEGHENEVKSVAWSHSGHYMATCGRDKTVWVWETADDNEFECAAVLFNHAQDVKKVVWQPGKDVVASCSYDDTIKMFHEDGTEWAQCANLTSHTSTVWSIAFNSTGDRLVSASDDLTLKIWQEYPPGNAQGIETPDNVSAWKCVCTLSGYHPRTVYDVAWCPLTGCIASACGDDKVRVFAESPESDAHAPTFQMEASGEGHTQDVNAVAWNPKEAGVLASTSDDGTVRLWTYK